MAFIEIDDHGRPFGWITFDLFDDVCPKACHNFRMLCVGQSQLSRSGRPLHYKGTSIFRIIPGFVIQGGDVVNDNGTSGETVYGSVFFADELSPVYHDRPGLLCTASLGRPDTNTSQFYITTGPCPWQDGRDTIFGQVAGGMKVVCRLDQLGSPRGTVHGDLKISNCGILPAPERQLQQSSQRPTFESDGDTLDD